ncbi:MAG TPA: hypothetical protein VD794_11730 [Flavisolibacter sp.]|nr:hypothetical protein [Flavisolibacter sp.]
MKVLVGVLYGGIGIYFGTKLQMMDTWYFHYKGLNEYQLLQSHPVDFFTSFFHNPFQEGYSNFLNSKYSWWNEAKYILFNKLLAIFDLFSLGNYYTNVIFYSFITLFGPIALYRILKDIFPNSEKILQLGVFFIPSFIFWNSGIHKDGLIFLSFALLSYHLYFGFKEGKFTWQRLFYIILALLLLILRSFVLIVLLPALVAWVIAHKSRLRPLLVFVTIYLLFISLFFTSHLIFPKVNLMQAVSARQQEFMVLHGNSSVKVHPLEPTFLGFIRNTPQALTLTILRPYPSDAHHSFSLIACVETILILLLFILFLFYRKKEKATSTFLIYSLFLSFSMLLMIGYTVNILGAIVRYRSITLPFLIAPMIAMIDWKKIIHIR